MSSEPERMTLASATARGIERVRRPIWAEPLDHLKIDIVHARLGPWAHLYAPANLDCNGCDPFDICLLIVPDECEWVPYAGPLPDSDEYRAAQARYAGVFSKGSAKT